MRRNTYAYKVLSLSFSRNSISNYAGSGTLILEYFNYSIGRRVPQIDYVYIIKSLSLFSALSRNPVYAKVVKINIINYDIMEKSLICLKFSQELHIVVLLLIL